MKTNGYQKGRRVKKEVADRVRAQDGKVGYNGSRGDSS